MEHPFRPRLTHSLDWLKPGKVPVSQSWTEVGGDRRCKDHFRSLQTLR